MKSLIRLFKYTLNYKRNMAISLFAMFIQVLVGFVIPVLMITIIDEAIPTNDINQLLRVGGLMVVIAFIGLGAGLLNSYHSQRLAIFSTADLRSTLFKKIQQLSFKNINDLKVSHLITASTNDVLRIQQFYQMLFRIIVRAPLMVGIGFFMALRTSTQLSNVFYIAIPVLIISIVIIMILAFPLFSKVQKATDALNKVSLESAKSPRVIKSFVTMDYENTRFSEQNQLFKDINTKAERIMVAAEPIMMFIFNATIAGLLFLGAYYFNQGFLINTIDGAQVPAVGVIVAFNNYSMQILFGVLMFAMMMIFVSRALVSANRIVEVLETDIDLVDCEDCITDFEISGAFAFNNVSFSYGDHGNNVLNDISFKVNAKEKIGIIGSTGSGKSTLIQLIPRLYDVTEGSITFDGIDVRKLSIDVLREQISVVTQQATIFSGSIGTNIRYGKQDADFETLKEASKNANAFEFVSEYDDFFNHIIEQSGSNLSGGQKQRISLARAFVRNPKLLILDDSTSAVDAKSEEKILSAIDGLTHQMTTLVISQKISTIKDMDKIIVLDNKGKIDGYDRHEVLMKTSDVYQEIAASQLGGKING